MKVIDRIALVLLIIGGLNWGSVGIFGLDVVAALFGGSASALSRVVYVLVCLSASGASRSSSGKTASSGPRGGVCNGSPP